MIVDIELREIEKQVIKHLFLLKKTKEIAEILKTSQAAIKRILDKLYNLIGNGDRLALVLWAQNNGFVYHHDSGQVYFEGQLI
jgi:hypothetical protein